MTWQDEFRSAIEAVVEPTGKWLARIWNRNLGKMQHIGLFAKESDAAVAYSAAREQLRQGDGS